MNVERPISGRDGPSGPTEVPRISVIVPCRNHARDLAGCLGALQQQRISVPYEVIVVDSGLDPAVEGVVAGFPDVRLVRSASPLLPGPARNLGAAHSRGEYLAFLDADCIPETAWLAAALAGLMHGTRTGGAAAGQPVMVGGAVLDLLPLHPIAVSDNLLQFADFAPARPDGSATYFPACNMAIRRAAFRELGGFPEADIQAGEDTLLCSAALQRWPQGLRFVRGMRVRHRGRAYLADFLRHQMHFGYWRGALGLHLKASHARLGRRRSMILPVALKRLSYIFGRTVAWNPRSLPRTLGVLPVLTAGLIAWSIGFRRGLLAAWSSPET